MPPPTSVFERKVGPKPRLYNTDFRCRVLAIQAQRYLAAQRQRGRPAPPPPPPPPPQRPSSEDNWFGEAPDITLRRLIQACNLRAEELANLELLSLDRIDDLPLEDADDITTVGLDDDAMEPLPQEPDADGNTTMDLVDATELSLQVPDANDITTVSLDDVAEVSSDAADTTDLGETATLEPGSSPLESESRDDDSSGSDNSMSDMTTGSSVWSSDSFRSFKVQGLNQLVWTMSAGPPETGFLHRREPADDILWIMELHRRKLAFKTGHARFHMFTLRARPKAKIPAQTLPLREGFHSIKASPLRASITMERWELAWTGDVFLDDMTFKMEEQPEVKYTNWNVW